jgi:hypothetical protein
MALRFRNIPGDEYTRTTNLPSTAAITFCCAMKSDVFKGLGFIFTLSQDANNFMVLNWGTIPQNMSAVMRFGGAQLGSSVTGRLVLKEWLFVVFQREAATTSVTGGIGRLYSADPLQYATNAAVSGSNFTPSILVFGDSPDFAGDELYSDLSCARIWTSILTPAQIERERQAIAAGVMRAVTTANLHADYPFLSKETATQDVSGNGFHLTAGTAVTTVGPRNRKPLRAAYFRQALAATRPMRLRRRMGVGQ